MNSVALEDGGHHAGHARSRGRHGSSATRRASPRAPCTRARWTWWSAMPPDARGRASYPGLLKGQAYLHSLGITGVAGRDRGDHDRGPTTCDAYVGAARQRRPHGARGGRALVGSSPRSRADRGSARATRTRARRAGSRATSVKIMQDGVLRELHRRRARALPRRERSAHREPGHLVRGARAAEAGRDRGSTPRASRCTSTRSADRAVREGLDAIEAALEANGPSDRRHHLAHLQVVHPDDIPRFRELGAVANAQPLWAAHESQMDDLTIPFLGEPRWRLAVPVRAASCARAPPSRWAATGASRRPTRSRRSTWR